MNMLLTPRITELAATQATRRMALVGQDSEKHRVREVCVERFEEEGGDGDAAVNQLAVAANPGRGRSAGRR
jgi:hypothetical protein